MTNTIMEQEARTAPQKIADQLEANAGIMQQLGERLRAFAPVL
ncbi:glutamine--fructose-6-phosphate aminotransferase [Shewanella putrefaciens]|nr:glutamine--fructose-6-phosphate aminotransferase [Shewanella putrefaciens]